MSHSTSECLITVRVTPRSSRPGIEVAEDGTLKVKVSSPPADGEANRELVRLVAKAVGVPPSAVAIVAGETSRTKRLKIVGADPERLEKLFAA